MDSRRAELAARLASSAGRRGVVCIGCVPAFDRGLVTLSPPPLNEPSVDLDRVLLAIAPAADRGLLDLAAAAVPEVWLVEEENLLTALAVPVDGLYRRRSLVLPGDRVRLVALPEVELVPLPCC